MTFSYQMVCAALANYCGFGGEDIASITITDLQHENQVVLHDGTMLTVLCKDSVPTVEASTPVAIVQEEASDAKPLG